MRFSVIFLVIAAVWLAASELWTGGDGFDVSFDGIKRFLFAEQVDRDAPNWGDVANKIGELSSERSNLSEEIDQTPGESPAQ